jgi:cysteine desulfurase
MPDQTSATPVFLDAAAGLPLHPAARATLLAALDEGWADPAKLYGAGRRARQLLDGARASLAASLGCRADEVVLAPGGCAASRWAVEGALTARWEHRHAVHSAVEHSCVLHAVGLHASGPTSVAVDRLGRVDADAFVAACRPDTAVACLTAGSHEVGTLQPVDEVAGLLAGTPLHVDASQAVGRTTVPTGWDLLSADARQWGGPTGIGVLAVRTGTRWRPVLPGGAREDLVDLPSALAAAVGLEAVLAEARDEEQRLRGLVAHLRARVPDLVPDVEVVGDPEARLPHVLTFSCLYADGEALLTGLDRAGFAVSSGSSCTSSTLDPSHVLVAMGVLTHGNVRVSLHRGTTEQDLERFLQVLPGVVHEVRRAGGALDL